MRPRSYDSPAVHEIVRQWELERPAWEAEQRRRDDIEEMRAALRREKLRERARARKARKAEWTAGVAKIMAEVRRREIERATPEHPFFASDNPLDGERLFV